MGNNNIIFKRDYGTMSIHVVKPPHGEVELMSHMTGMDHLVTNVSNVYKGVIANNRMLKQSDINEAFDDQHKTQLHTPMEMLHTAWLITGVTRAFTHQLVRTRLASYAQESMRFMGHKGVYEVLATGDLLRMGNEQMLQEYCDTIKLQILTYERMLQAGISAEDARGVLPTNIVTSIIVGWSISTLAHVYNQRVCCQAQQGEWVPVLQEMKKQLGTVSPLVAGLLTAPIDRGESCGYGASFDRPCKWRK
jgi:thymidylate synthase (FAD)